MSACFEFVDEPVDWILFFKSKLKPILRKLKFTLPTNGDL